MNNLFGSILIIFVFAIPCASGNTEDLDLALKMARKYVSEKDYAKALENYTWFFENSIKKEDSMLAVRLSVCLHEWRELGNLYKPALNRYRSEMSNRKKMLANGENNLYLFLEYSAFCKYDDKEKESIDLFLYFHDGKDKEFAKRIFSVINQDLLRLGYFDICNEYLIDPLKYLEKIKPLYYHDKEFYNEEVIFLLIVLKKNSRIGEYEQVKDKLAADGLTQEIQNKIIELEN